MARPYTRAQRANKGSLGDRRERRGGDEPVATGSTNIADAVKKAAHATARLASQNPWGTLVMGEGCARLVTISGRALRSVAP